MDESEGDVSGSCVGKAGLVEVGKDVALHPPRGAGRPVHRLTNTLRLGVLGGLAVHGGVNRKILLAATKTGHGIDWGASYRSP